MGFVDLKVGDKARILGFHPGNKHYQHRLLTLGLIPTVEFTVNRVAPLGDPVELRLQDFSLCLRKQEAAMLHIEKLLE